MKGKRASPAVAAADGMLYVIGGDITHTINSYRSHITISSVERYNNSTSQWEDLPSLPESRSEAGVAVL
jgi:actin-binding protein IPP